MTDLVYLQGRVFKEQIPDTSRMPSGFREQALELASKNGSVPGDYAANRPHRGYSLGNRNPDFSTGIKISATGEVKDPSTFFSALNGTLVQLSGYQARACHQIKFRAQICGF